MADPRTLPTPQLFKAWRAGDGVAGGVMAQRFSDWYYAVTASRLGDLHGRAPLTQACARFQQGIVSVTNPALLADWAHGILAEELSQAGGRIAGGDFSNALTGGRSPTELLRAASAALPPAQVQLLGHAYDNAFPMERLTEEAEALGGMPVAVLQARHALKRELRENHGVGFTEVPEHPNLDCAPLPVYEAGRMESAAEEAGFEKWLLSDMALCKDIAEFGVFALALRAGAFSGSRPAQPIASPASVAPPTASPPTASPPDQPTPAAPPAAPGGGGRNLLLVGAAVVVLGLIALALLVGIAMKLLG